MLSTEQKTTQLYKHFLNVSDTRDNRDFYEEAIQSSFCVRPDQLLKYGDKIPRGGSEDELESIRNLKDGETFNFAVDENEKVPIIKFYKDYPLTMIDKGTDNAFKLIDKISGETIKNIIPFNYYKDVYNYDLRTNAENGSKKIYFGVGDWVLDTFSGVLKFYGTVPKGIDHNNPPTISFYQYVGGTGFRTDTIGYEGIIIPVKDWYISKGRYLLNTVNDDITLERKISLACNVIQGGYTSVYGFDGSDTNEGVAYSLNTITSLAYTSNKDSVKGHDESYDSDIGVLLSRKVADLESDKAKVSFCSHNVLATDNAISHKLKISDGTISFDGGKNVIARDIVKVPDTLGNFIVVEGSTKLDPGEYEFTVKEDTTTGIMLYWDKTEHDYLPYINNEDNNFNFGVPVVNAVGRIPPSVSIGSVSLNDFGDSITPDYYGPRNYTITIAVQDELNYKSADYVVKNYKGFYLDDIFNKIIADYTKDDELNFKGTIYLRSGTYTVDGASLDLSKFNNLVIKGEDKNTTIIDGNVKLINDKKGSIVFNDITVKDILVNVSNMSVTTNEVIADNVKFIKGDNLAFIKNSSIENIEIQDSKSRLENNSDELGNIWNNIEGSTIGSAKALTGHTFYNGDTIGTLTFADVNMDMAKSCFIQRVDSKPSQTQLFGCTVFTFDNTAFSEVPRMKHFPIYSKDSDRCLEYATFANPFEITYDKENGNTVNLKYDVDNFKIDPEKGLCCAIHADQIIIDVDQFKRNVNYEGDAPNVAVANGNIQEALNDLYGTKADLNPDGKVPLEELPDSVAYGGLLYVGTHSFEYIDNIKGNESDNYYVDGGAYPTYNDANVELSVDKTQVDSEGNSILQPGWFWIVSSSKKNIDKPAAIQKAALQDGETTPLEFTAGDWVIWNGKKFEKLDRAYQDVAYMVLPIYTTGEHLHWSWQEADENGEKYGIGALELGGVTIAEGFDMINQELLKLRVKHPCLLKDIKLVPYYGDYKKIGYYKIDNCIVSAQLTDAYDLLKDKDRVSKFRVKTPRAETNPWEKAVYVENDTVFDANVDAVEKQITYNPTNTSPLTVDGVCFQPAFDPYENEIVGAGFWKATYVDFGGENLKDGKHQFVLGITDAKVNNDLVDIRSYTPTYYVDLAEKRDYTVDGNCLAKLGDIATINGSAIELAEVAGYCSGIPTINTEFVFRLNFNVSNAVDCVNIDRAPLQIRDDLTGKTFDVNNFNNITLSNGTVDGMYNIQVKELDYTLPENSASSEIRSLSVNALDVYKNSYNLPGLVDLKVVYAPGLTEKERVRSGVGQYPTFLPSNKTKCGYPYSSQSSLLVACTNELMKSARTVDDKIVYEYSWPDGKYETYTKTIDYSNTTTGNSITIDGVVYTYRWATITKSWNGEEFEDIILDETSGFTLDINVSSDMEDVFELNEYDMTLNSDELKIEAAVVDYSTGSSITKWFECNKAYDGYAEIGTINGQGAMYAGSSTKFTKRITFGPKVYSGNLLFRIGLRVGSKLRIQSLTVRDLI